MNMQEHDDDFDLRLSKRERLLPQFDAELDGPDADTDRLLIARARRATHPVQLRSPASKTFRAPRWAVPVGLAATLVLSFTLLLHTNPPQVAKPVSAPISSQEVSESAISADASGASAPAEMRARREAPVAPTAATMNRAPSDSAAVSEVQEEIAIQPPIVMKAMPAPSAAPPPPLPAQASANAERAEAYAGAAAESAADASTQRSAAAPLDPDSWLRRVERLRSRGLDAEARRELQAFRQQYPDHPLPAELQALLPAP
jgi:hypothetical protein